MPRRGRRRGGQRRHVEDLLDQLQGKPDADGQERKDREWRGHRTLDVKRNNDLFTALVTMDFDYLMSQSFAASPRALADLLPQSVVGRAQNGHGLFVDDFGTPLQFPDASFDRVLTVLEAADPNLKSFLVRQRRSDMLTRFGSWIMERIKSPELELVIDGAPLFGVDFLADQKVDTRAFLTGLVLAGFMDDWSYRETTMFRHKRTFGGMPFHIGGGDILIVDQENFEACGLGDTGNTVFVDEQIRTLKDIGVICRDQNAAYSYPQFDQAYFRRRMGDGVCDDLAMIYIGAKYGWSAMLGAFVMDAIDTYDKYLLNMTWGGFDTALARGIQRWFRDEEDQPLVCDSEILDLIHFSAKRNEPTINLSSSHRRLIQVEKHSKVATVLNHWRFLCGEPVFDVRLGYSRVEAGAFYGVAGSRLAHVGMPVVMGELVRG